MVQIIRLAVLSAALAAALITALEPKRPAQSAGQFLIEHLDQQVTPEATQAKHACASRGWPYPDECLAPTREGAAHHGVRIIGLDDMDAVRGSRSAMSQLATR